MATAPRSIDEVLESIRFTWNDIDPSIDINKGPFAVMAFGFAGEISRNETMANYLTTVYQLEKANSIDIEDLEAFGNNYGLDPNVGRQAFVYCTFYRASRPEENYAYQVLSGDIVGTKDGRYLFTVLDDAVMSGDTPDIYYNPSERRYEITVRAQASAVGDDFNLPRGTINTIFSGGQHFDGVVNKTPSSRGADPINSTQFVNIIRTNLLGLNVDMAGRIHNVIREIDPTNTSDIQLVHSSDYEIFERLKDVRGRTAYDVYVLTDSLTEELQTYTAFGGEYSVTLEMAPVQSVQYVTVDGTNVGFMFQPDATRAHRHSPLAQDKVFLPGMTLQPGQVVHIRYFYYETIRKSWEALQSRAKPFGNDVLVRLPYSVQVYVRARLTSTSAVDRDQVVASVLDFTDSYFRDPGLPSAARRKFITLLEPGDYRDAVIATVPGIVNFSLLNFARMDVAVQDVSVIEFNGRNEFPVLSPTSQIV